MLKLKKIFLMALLFVFVCYLSVIFVPITNIIGTEPMLDTLTIHTYESDGVTPKIIYKENPRYINELDISSVTRNNYIPEFNIYTYDDTDIDEFYSQLSQFKFKPYVVRNIDFDNQKTELYYNKSHILMYTTNSSKAKYFPFEFHPYIRVYGDYTNERYNVYAVDLEIVLHEKHLLNRSLMYHLPNSQIEEFDKLVNLYIINNKEIFEN